MNVETYRQLEARFETILAGVLDMLDDETASSVEHFLDHAELEMAFEGLCLELMRLRKSAPANLSNDILALAKASGLDKHSVFDAEFWPKLHRFTLSEEQAH
jgi:hypothetical protein